MSPIQPIRIFQLTKSTKTETNQWTNEKIWNIMYRARYVRSLKGGIWIWVQLKRTNCGVVRCALICWDGCVAGGVGRLTPAADIDACCFLSRSFCFLSRVTCACCSPNHFSYSSIGIIYNECIRFNSSDYFHFKLLYLKLRPSVKHNSITFD